jgi:hypothetical protein
MRQILFKYSLILSLLAATWTHASASSEARAAQAHACSFHSGAKIAAGQSLPLRSPSRHGSSQACLRVNHLRRLSFPRPQVSPQDPERPVATQENPSSPPTSQFSKEFFHPPA